MPPERSDLVLSTNIPHCELNVLVLYGLHVESDGRDGGAEEVSILSLPTTGAYVHNLAELQLVEDGGLSSGVKTDHEDSHFFLSP